MNKKKSSSPCLSSFLIKDILSNKKTGKKRKKKKPSSSSSSATGGGGKVSHTIPAMTEMMIFWSLWMIHRKYPRTRMETKLGDRQKQRDEEVPIIPTLSYGQEAAGHGPEQKGQELTIIRFGSDPVGERISGCNAGGLPCLLKPVEPNPGADGIIPCHNPDSLPSSSSYLHQDHRFPFQLLPPPPPPQPSSVRHPLSITSTSSSLNPPFTPPLHLDPQNWSSLSSITGTSIAGSWTHGSGNDDSLSSKLSWSVRSSIPV